MSYLYQNSERFTTKLLVEKPELIDRLNPWWFFDDNAKSIAWSIYNAKKNNIVWNDIKDILDERGDPVMVDKYLEIDLPDPKVVNDVIEYYILGSQIFEIAEKDLEKSILSKKELQTLRAISEKLKVYKWNDKVIEYVRDMHIKVTNDHKTKKDRIATRRQQLSKRFE